MIDRLKHIAALNEERGELIDTLRLWAEVKKQGINPDEVDSFGFEEKFLSKRDADLLRGKSDRLPDGKYSCPVYNSVKRHDGTTVKLDPILRVPGKKWPVLNVTRTRLTSLKYMVD